jgi:hypothetical protein
MKLAHLILSSFLLVTVLAVSACDQGSDKQGGPGSAPSKEGGGTAPSRGPAGQ